MTVHPHRVRTWRPTPLQSLLLRAALLPRDEAVAAWATVRPHLDLDRLDHGSLRLCALLYRGLREHGVDDPWLERFKGVYRHSWAHNALLFHDAGALLRALGAAGIDTLVLKGAALVELYYRDRGVRPMEDFDVLVPWARREAAIDVLRRAGWTPAERLGPAELRWRHGAVFANPAGRRCDLHWAAYGERCAPDADAALWAAARAVTLCSAPTRVLAPADLLLHLCVHGARWEPVSTVRWAADALTLLRAASIDWRLLLQRAAAWGFLPRLRAALGYLRAVLDAPVPDAVWARLVAHRPTAAERLEWRVWSREAPLLGYFSREWCLHRRHVGGGLAALTGFPAYLADVWHLDSPRQVPLQAAAYAAARLRAVRLRGALP